MDLSEIKSLEVFNLPKMIISNDEIIIHSGQQTDKAFLILDGTVTEDEPYRNSDKSYHKGEVVCLLDFLGSNTYSKSQKAYAGTILLCLTVEMFKEMVLCGDKFAWSLSKLLAAECLNRL